MAVSSMDTSQNGTTALLEMLIKMNFSKAVAKQAVTIFAEHDPGIAPHITTIFNGGVIADTPAAQLIARYMEDSLKEIVNETIHRDDYDHGRSALQTLYLPTVKTRVTGAWYAATVTLEINPRATLGDFSSNETRMAENNALHNPHPHSATTLSNDHYWRGLVRLAISLCEVDNITFATVEWIGQQSNPLSIIKLIKDRDTIDIELLKLAVQGQTPTALTEGLL